MVFFSDLHSHFGLVKRGLRAQEAAAVPEMG
jgi:hypothetical protein